jgi:hypothetical protein
MISLLILIFQGLVIHASRFRAWRMISAILLISFCAAFVTYGVARAAEPILPWLGPPVEEHHHDESVPAEEDHHHDGSFVDSFI